MRARLIAAPQELPRLEGFQPLLVVWRFPHLEPCNRSWTLLSEAGSLRGMLRLAEWTADFESEQLADADEVRVVDHPLNDEDLVAVFDLFSKVEILGDQRGGIYDGPKFGLILFDADTGEVASREEWIHEETLEHAVERLPVAVRKWFQEA